ncbi:MAG: nicotinate (nicotinamide) nucleotide adenylyltransferase [Verrucomicrobiales bacterium]|jgi:nicotinate-nucleotide adenylyltransferase|nr:nicotinate (nicotinamide) nucleotide adenylyltransferase [Verrucomicrobiales bacterium]
MAMIGLFGGTFDPVHVGHELMVSVSFKLGLERVVVMPCFLSPHKTDLSANDEPASGDDRVRMLELAVSGLHGVEVSRFELDKGGVSYTWQTLEFLREKHPHDRLALIVGLDQYHAFPRWERFAEWSRGLDIFVFRREGVALPPGEPVQGPVYHWPEDEIPEVSASEIRCRVRSGKSLEGLVSAQVEEYIRIKRLYLGK